MVLNYGCTLVTSNILAKPQTPVILIKLAWSAVFQKLLKLFESEATLENHQMGGLGNNENVCFSKHIRTDFQERR